MNRRKLNHLFTWARNDQSPVPPNDFPDDVLRAIRGEAAIAGESISLPDQLNLFFPRIALAASAVIVICVVLDYGLTAAGIPSLSDGAAQLSAQWFLTPTGL